MFPKPGKLWLEFRTEGTLFPGGSYHTFHEPGSQTGGIVYVLSPDKAAGEYGAEQITGAVEVAIALALFFFSAKVYGVHKGKMGVRATIKTSITDCRVYA